jgi:hypothetical protein
VYDVAASWFRGMPPQSPIAAYRWRADNSPGTTGEQRTARVSHAAIPPSGRTGTISITAWVRRASWNAMKPRIHCVLTP